MTRDDYIKLHRQTVAAIDLVDMHGLQNCIVECNDMDGYGDWERCISGPTYNARYYRARLKPTKKIVPWSSLDEVPLTHWFRRKGSDFLLRPTGARKCEVQLFAQFIPFDRLADEFEHAAPCDKHSDLIWLPCGKEVVE